MKTGSSHFIFYINNDIFQCASTLPGYKGQGAVTTLEKIEIILRDKKRWIPLNAQDNGVPKGQEQQRKRLGEIAHLILDNYLKKARNSYCFQEDTNESALKLKAIVRSIDNYLNPPAILPLPPEIIAQIARLVFNGWRRIASLNRFGHSLGVILRAKELGYTAKTMTAAKAHHYLICLLEELRKVRRLGFLPEKGLFIHKDEILSNLKVLNSKGESLLHLAANNNFPFITKLALTEDKFSKHINRKENRETAIQIADHNKYTKLVKILSRHGAEMENTKLISFLLTTDCLYHIFSYLNKSQLALCTRVCKAWDKTASLNRLWEPFYRHHFPKASPAKTSLISEGYWKDKLANFFVNFSGAIFSETVIPHAGQFLNQLIILENHLLIQSDHQLHLWSKNQADKFEQTKVIQNYYANNPLQDKTRFTGDMIAYLTDRIVKLTDLSSLSTKTLSFNFSLSEIRKGDDRLFVQGTDGSLHVIGRKTENDFAVPGRVELPSLDAEFRGASGEWLVVQDGAYTHLLKRSTREDIKTEGTLFYPIEIDYYQPHQILADGSSDYPFISNLQTRFTFSKTPEGLPMLIANTPPAPNGEWNKVAAWQFNPNDNQWKLLFTEEDRKFLATDGQYVFFFGLPQRHCWSWKRYSLPVYIKKWDADANTYADRGEVKKSHIVSVPLDSDPQSPSFDSLLNNHLTFATLHGILVIGNTQESGLVFVDARCTPPKAIELPRGDHIDLQAGCLNYEKLNNGTFRESKIFGKTLPSFPYAERILGMTSDGSLVTSDKGRGFIIRKFDVKKSTVLAEIADKFLQCPSLKEFKSEEEVMNLAYLNHRFMKFDKQIRNEIYNKLNHALGNPVSGEIVPFLQFHNGYFPFTKRYSVSSEDRKPEVKYSSTKEQIANAIYGHIAYLIRNEKSQQD